MKGLYAILKIDSLSTESEIRSAYRRLAKDHHPDRGGNPRLFCDIKEAYEVLSNPASREKYDSELARRPFGGDEYRTLVPSVTRQPMDIFDDVVDVLSRRFGYEPESRHDVDIILTPQEAARGLNVELRVPREKICDNCFGFGGTILWACERCSGSGMLRGYGRAYLRIGPGADRGDVVISRTGDLLIRGRIDIEP
jgi:DnaJ-class molecular chaperone